MIDWHAVLDRYAYFKKLDYFSTECVYSPDAYRGHARAFLKDLEAARPSAIIDIIHSGEAFEVKEEVKATQKAQRMFLRQREWQRSAVLTTILQRPVGGAVTCPVMTSARRVHCWKDWSGALPRWRYSRICSCATQPDRWSSRYTSTN